MHLADAQVGARVEGAAVGHGPGVGQQLTSRRLGVVGEAGQPADLLGHLLHLLAGLQEALGVAAIDMASVQGDESSRRVEHVDGRGVEAVGVAHRVGQHRAQPGLSGDPGHPGGVGGAVGKAVRDQLDDQVVAGHDGLPRRQRRQREVVAPAPRRHARLGGGAEQHHHVAAHEVGRQRLQGRHRPASLTGEVGGRDHPADRRPARLAGRQERHPGQPAPMGRQVAVGAAADRGARSLPPRGGRARPGHRRHGQVHPQDRPDAGPRAGLGELHRAVRAVAIGEGERVHLLLDGALDEGLRVGCPVLQGVARGHMEMDERVRRHRTDRPSDQLRRGVGRDGHGAPGPAPTRSRPGTGPRHGPGRRPRAR
ncbi:DNA polymerase III subunit alpha [Nocardioides sp. CF8]|nr:DNA polymerase III subunit alpha [Nocardioides sp. CF8]